MDGSSGFEILITSLGAAAILFALLHHSRHSCQLTAHRMSEGLLQIDVMLMQRARSTMLPILAMTVTWEGDRGW